MIFSFRGTSAQWVRVNSAQEKKAPTFGFLYGNFLIVITSKSIYIKYLCYDDDTSAHCNLQFYQHLEIICIYIQILMN